MKGYVTDATMPGVLVNNIRDRAIDLGTQIMWRNKRDGTPTSQAVVRGFNLPFLTDG